MTHQIARLLETLVEDESGQDLVEYALVAVLVGLGVVASMKGVATAIGGVFANVAATLTTST